MQIITPGLEDGAPDVFPQYPDGIDGLRTYLSKNLKYPASAKEKKIEGKVLVNFIVNTLGKVERIKVVKGIDHELDAEAIRVIRVMDDWKPAEKNGTAVNFEYTIPIQFKL